MEKENIRDVLAAGPSPQEQLSLGDQFHRLLRSAIIRGEFLPGQSIFETEMSKLFSISRQPVREAFILLANERLIEVRPKRGTYVRKISMKEVLDARHVREVIEVSIVREVAQHHEAALVKRLRSLVARQKRVKHGDNQGFLVLDEEFHRTLALHANREYAWRIIDSAKAQMDRVRYLSYDFASPTRELADDHSTLVDSIASGDPELAAHALKDHLRKILVSLPLVAERYPDFFAK